MLTTAFQLAKVRQVLKLVFRLRLCVVEATPVCDAWRRLDRDVGSLPAVPLPRTGSRPRQIQALPESA